MKTEFINISPNEWKFTYKGKKFLLKEQSRGVFGMGKSVQLYELNELNKSHIKEIGWTKSDNSLSDIDQSLIPHITTIEECKKEVIKYLDKLMS